jgi:hypothetical protein
VHGVDNYELHCRILRENKLVVNPIDNDAIMSNKEAVVSRTDIETKCVGECVMKKLIEELGRELVSIERLGQSETFSCLLTESWWQ